MNKSEFVSLIKEVVSDSAVEDTMENLQSPPGRKPNEEMMKRFSMVQRLI
ncbi:hypothetical protein ACLKMH_12115 [Psychromonas sp. KJ10-10]